MRKRKGISQHTHYRHTAQKRKHNNVVKKSRRTSDDQRANGLSSSESDNDSALEINQSKVPSIDHVASDHLTNDDPSLTGNNLCNGNCVMNNSRLATTLNFEKMNDRFLSRIMQEWIPCDCCTTLTRISLCQRNANLLHSHLGPAAQLCKPCSRFHPSMAKRFCHRNPNLNNLLTGMNFEKSFKKKMNDCDTWIVNIY